MTTTSRLKTIELPSYPKISSRLRATRLLSPRAPVYQPLSHRLQSKPSVPQPPQKPKTSNHPWSWRPPHHPTYLPQSCHKSQRPPACPSQSINWWTIQTSSLSDQVIKVIQCKALGQPEQFVGIFLNLWYLTRTVTKNIFSVFDLVFPHLL